MLDHHLKNLFFPGFQSERYSELSISDLYQRGHINISPGQTRPEKVGCSWYVASSCHPLIKIDKYWNIVSS